MDGFLEFLDQQRNGIFVLLTCVAFVILMIQWITWIFRWGRFKRLENGKSGSSREGQTQFVFGEFLAKVISDFRNLLAVLIVLVFTFILAYVMLKSKTQGEITASLQAVMATLGGLVGSIVGYYFGETAAKSAAQSSAETQTTPAQQMIQRNTSPENAQNNEEKIQTPPIPSQLAPKISRRTKQTKNGG